ncbi:hypothetical protein OH76DRAFT_1488680 [Lentinus brumalis]|nr:hypothetical protein OH76DRAFT_1488680 [Polyporus brumalis]
MSASQSAPVCSFVGRSAPAPASACAPTVFSNSPTLNQSPPSSEALDDATVRAGPVPKRRIGCVNVLASSRMHMHPDDVETVMHEFYPGAVGAAPPHDIPTLGGPGPGTSRQETATPSSSGLARSPSVGGWQGRARSRSFASDEGAAGRRHALLRSKAAAPAHAHVNGDGHDMHERGVVRSMSPRTGRSHSDDSCEDVVS